MSSFMMLTFCWEGNSLVWTLPLSHFSWGFVWYWSRLGFVGLPGPDSPNESLFGFVAAACFFITASCFFVTASCFFSCSPFWSFGVLLNSSRICGFRCGTFWFSGDGFLPFSRFLMNPPPFRGSETPSPRKMIYYH